MKYGIILMLVCAFTITSYSQNDKPRTNTTAAQVESSMEIPKPVNTWVTTYYPKNKVAKNTMDKTNMSASNTLFLDNGVVLQFNDKNEITSIDGKSSIPTTLVPAKIATYVTQNNAGSEIYSWQWVDSNVQQIMLDNGQKIQFSKSGDLITSDK